MPILAFRSAKAYRMSDEHATLYTEDEIGFDHKKQRITMPLGQNRVACPPDGRSALDGDIAGVDMCFVEDKGL